MRPINTDIVGMRFGQLEVIKPTRRGKGCIFYLCKCDCGEEKEIRRGCLLINGITSCGCAFSRKKIDSDLIGERFGRLEVIGHVEKDADNRLVHLCECDCGIEKPILRSSLLSNRTKSCGCLSKENKQSTLIDMLGQVIGYLTVLEQVQVPGKTGSHWKCKCVCGAIKTISGNNLRGGMKSCGCKQFRGKTNAKYTPLEASARQVYRRYRDGDLTYEDFLELSQMNCDYCGIEPGTVYNKCKRRKSYTEEENEVGKFVYNGIDRVNSNSPHNKDNCVPCCWECNRDKLNLSIEEFDRRTIVRYIQLMKKLGMDRWGNKLIV